MLVTISKASPIGSQVIDDLTITIAADELTQRRMQRDADAIVEALHATLPQGTWTRLVAGVAKRAAIAARFPDGSGSLRRGAARDRASP